MSGIHAGWIFLGIAVIALFGALMGPSRRLPIGNGSILHEFLITMLGLAVVAGFFMFLFLPLKGAWLYIVALPIALVLAGLLFMGVIRILAPPGAQAAPPAGPAAQDPAPAEPFRLLEDPAEADNRLPLSVIENEPPLPPPTGQRGRFSRAPRQKRPFDTDAWIRAGFQKYFYLLMATVFGSATAWFILLREWEAVQGGVLVTVLSALAFLDARRRLKQF